MWTSFKDLFQPVEVRACISVLKNEINNYSIVHHDANVSIGLTVVTPMIRENLINEADKVKEEIGAKKACPESIVYTMLEAQCDKLIRSSRFHGQSGRLSLQGMGIQALWVKVSDELVRLGLWQHEEAAEKRVEFIRLCEG